MAKSSLHQELLSLIYHKKCNIMPTNSNINVNRLSKMVKTVFYEHSYYSKLNLNSSNSDNLIYLLWVFNVKNPLDVRFMIEQ